MRRSAAGTAPPSATSGAFRVTTRPWGSCARCGTPSRRPWGCSMRGGGDLADREFCRAILPKVSRTFALGIRLLPAGLEEAVRTSYLLCRSADTIEDSADLPAARKDALLTELRRCLDDPQ